MRGCRSAQPCIAHSREQGTQSTRSVWLGSAREFREYWPQLTRFFWAREAVAAMPFHWTLWARDYDGWRLKCRASSPSQVGPKERVRSDRTAALRSAPCLRRSSPDRLVPRRRRYPCTAPLAVGLHGTVSILGTEVYLHATRSCCSSRVIGSRGESRHEFPARQHASSAGGILLP